MKDIKFSICLVTYNQEKYIKETIESILSQTYQNFEIIVSDDCSTDKTLDVVRSIKDNRIKIVQTPYNMGINANLNNAIDNAAGDYLMFLGGDDKLRKDYLEKLNNILLTQDIAVFYANVTSIDEKGRYLIGENKLGCDFNLGSREDILHLSFMKTNRLPSVGMVIKKEVMAQVLPLNKSSIVYQDFKLNIDLLINQKNEFMLFDEIGTEYRKFNDSRNISNNKNGITKTRNMLETDVLMDSFLEIKDTDFLKRIFEKEIEETKIEPYSDTIPFFLGQMALLSKDKNRQVWGYKTIAKFISDKKGYDLAHEKYNFSFKDYLKLSTKINGDDKSDYYARYQRYKKLFNMTILSSGIIIGVLLILLILKIL